MKSDSTEINQFRVTEGEGASTDADGMNGNFTFKVGDAIVQVSSVQNSPEGWNHVICAAFEHPKSNIISRLTAQQPRPRMTNGEETMAVKRLFFEDDETVVEYWPKKGSFLPMSLHARHLWQRIHSDVATPENALKKSVQGEGRN